MQGDRAEGKGGKREQRGRTDHQDGDEGVKGGDRESKREGMQE